MASYIRGGLWSEPEDQVLTAAVQKYGPNQWSRISSLLVRRTARQCKARWNEWLDPALNKDAWSAEEDEKLLKLAKRLPNMWRTIAPMMNRPAQQVVERFRQLLSTEFSNASTADESKIALQSMGEDPGSRAAEAEMLLEAQARFANSLGKKAKRGLRERVEAQRKRDMILEDHRTNNSKLSIHPKKHTRDFNQGIPFELEVPAGPYNTLDEDVQDKKYNQALKHKLEEGTIMIGSKRNAPVQYPQKVAKRRELKLPAVVASASQPKYPQASRSDREKVKFLLLQLPAPVDPDALASLPLGNDEYEHEEDETAPRSYNAFGPDLQVSHKLIDDEVNSDAPLHVDSFLHPQPLPLNQKTSDKVAYLREAVSAHFRLAQNETKTQLWELNRVDLQYKEAHRALELEAVKMTVDAQINDLHGKV